jgi:hypothetical protein
VCKATPRTSIVVCMGRITTPRSAISRQSVEPTDIVSRAVCRESLLDVRLDWMQRGLQNMQFYDSVLSRPLFVGRSLWNGLCGRKMT